MSTLSERFPGEFALTKAHLKVCQVESVLTCFHGHCWENYELEWDDVTNMIEVLSDCVKDVDKAISAAEDKNLKQSLKVVPGGAS